MENVKDRITKLLALAKSPNENEAKLALLKARELMAQHKLSVDDIQNLEQQKVVQEAFPDVCFTPFTDLWVPFLSELIAEHYCCCSILYAKYRQKRKYIGFIGLEDDIALVKLIFPYAYDCVKAVCKRIDREQKAQGTSGKQIRLMCNTYGLGFCEGLKDAYAKQEQEHKEWALALTMPQSVQNATQDIESSDLTVDQELTTDTIPFWVDGMTEGKGFDPTTRVKEGKKNSDLLCE